MAKEKKHTGTKDQMDEHAHSILKALNSIDTHLASLVYHQSPSRGFGASIEKAVAQPYMEESKKLEDKIEKLVIEELRKLNEENK
jgi:HPt (histidine-containing phosphotransfer) domain-containing protein